MPLRVELARPQDLPSDLIAIGVPYWSSPDGPVLHGGLPPAVAGTSLPATIPADWALRAGFSAQPGQSTVLSAAFESTSLVALGLGDPAGVDADRWRRAAAALVGAAGQGGVAALAVPGAGADDAGGVRSGDALSAIAEGAMLAAYRYDEFRSDPQRPTIERLLVMPGVDGGPAGGPDAASSLRRGVTSAEAVGFARDLVNRPPSELAPSVFADLVVERFRGVGGVEIEVWGEHRIEDERLGGLLGVSRGSSQPPRFVKVAYRPSAAPLAPHLALVGKGITFDSGGLSLKTADGMTTMKTDMSGAAAVLAATWACAVEGLPVQVSAYAPITENMPGGRAIKPGDVLTARNGTTMEVLNTDAEGRLVLADALCLAAEERPDAIIDLATLTGAAVVALGSSIAALYGTTEPLVSAIQQAGLRAGEQCWQMPLAEQYRDHLDSDVADVKNIGRPGQAGSIVAALFLARFAGDVPWAHLDIAGPARAAEASGYLTKGGTGFGVRTLLELLRTRGSAGPS